MTVAGATSVCSPRPSLMQALVVSPLSTSLQLQCAPYCRAPRGRRSLPAHRFEESARVQLLRLRVLAGDGMARHPLKQLLSI
eukprot:3002798-Amphidinium_carterae.1